MAVAVDSLAGQVGRQTAIDLGQQVLGQAFVSRLDVRRDPAVFQQVGPALVTEPLGGEADAMFELPAAADLMHAGQGPGEYGEGVRIFQVRRVAALPGEDSEAKSLVRKQGLTRPDQRRHHRQLVLEELQAEGMLLADRGVAPAFRSIELGNHELAVVQLDLINPVFEAVECQQTAARLETGTLKRIQNQVRRQAVVRGI